MDFEVLRSKLKGEIYTDLLSKKIYATDASVYQEDPIAIVIPKTTEDIIEVVLFAGKKNTSIIPRSAGTSLAGQCVGNGIVVDISKYFKKIYDLDVQNQTVWVEPGVIRDELNEFLKPHGLFFGPNTSTANRCMIGGMTGNNSCGSSSIKYGSTRDHVLELEVILSDGSKATFGQIEKKLIHSISDSDTFEGRIYKQLINLINHEKVKENIKRHYPHPDIERRNTGYAIDLLINEAPFNPEASFLNLSTLLTGSEGTLAFTTAIKLHLNKLPPPEKIVVCPHFNSIIEAMKAVPIIMKFEPDMCELMDKIILDCTKSNKKQAENRFFLNGDPQAVLMVQFNRNSKEELDPIADQMIQALQNAGLGYSYPKVYAPDDLKVFELRAAGLGVLGNLPGDPKAVACIEDTAVRIDDLPDYIEAFQSLMKGFGQEAVFYAHAGAGEIHLRPILNLKKAKDIDLFYNITKSVAELVKKYNGSLSGEHGDGRVRAEFIPLMIGETNYEILKKIKAIWDPANIFNPGKIVNAAPMTSSLRYEAEMNTDQPATLFRFTSEGGIIRAAEKCNGSGDCRKLELSGGTMCPSYRATRDEKDVTRARANALRNFLTHPKNDNQPFDSPEIKEVLDLCLSCKACGTECPSSVDMTRLKSEFEYQYQKINGISRRTKFFANFETNNQLAQRFYPFSNWITQGRLTAPLIKKSLAIASKRSIPKTPKRTLRNYYLNNYEHLKAKWKKEVYLFCDEFTNLLDVQVGIASLELLKTLGYKVNIVAHYESGRAAFSKGVLDKAKICANENVRLFSKLVTANTPLIGVEPSAILSFRDEYPHIVDESLIDAAQELKKHTFTIEEFLYNEIIIGNITAQHFDQKNRTIAVHGHCHQKALSEMDMTYHLLSLPLSHHVEVIPSGCCGMAGSFGYEAEHYDISMKIGESVLFPYVRSAKPQMIIAAAGTSCRHQIWDGTKRKAFHPVEILNKAVIIN